MFSFALLAYHTRPTVKLLSGTAAVSLTTGRFVDLLDQFFLTVRLSCFFSVSLSVLEQAI